MSIKTKFSLAVTAVAIAAILLSGGAFLALETKGLKRSQEERTRLLLENVRNMARESQLAHDPLMLFDYLWYLERERKEIAGCRVYLNGEWRGIHGWKGPSPAALQASTRMVDVPPLEPGRGEVRVAVTLSPVALDRDLASAQKALLDDMGRVAAVVLPLAILASFLVGWRMTRRFLRIRAALAEIGRGHLKVRAHLDGADELAALAGDVNDMALKLSELDEMKKTFVAAVTHELRSPLALIETYLKRLLSQDRSRPSDEKEALERIRGNASRLGHFVGNLLDFARVEKGKLDCRPCPSELRALVEDAALFFKPKAEEAGLRLSVALPENSVPAVIDPDLITQVVTNLISNAVKFTPQGGSVQVRLERLSSGEPAADGRVRVSVEDTGVGIPREAMGRVFGAFERIRNPLRATGTGLGLAISKAIVELHGGSIGVSSDVGRGSRFYFELPASVAKRSDGPAAPSPGGRPLARGA